MEFIQQLAEEAGISLEDDIEIIDPQMYNRIIQSVSLGLGGSYIEGQWNTKGKSIDELFYLIIKSDLRSKLLNSYYWKLKLGWSWVWSYISNPQTIIRSKRVADVHYDLGNELFQYMLDPYMIYSCAKFEGDNIDDLNLAQEKKLELIGDKLKLQPGYYVLDIGCGWGGLAQYLAENYSVSVDGLTISLEQWLYANEHNQFSGSEEESLLVPFNYNRVRYYLKDYRQMDELAYRNSPKKYDAIVSVGMFEHVGPQNYRTFMEVAHKYLKDDGVLLIHTIGRNKSGLNSDPWLAKYIFPNSCLPSLAQICKASEGLFVIEDVENFGTSYDKTLMCWHRNFVKNFDRINEAREDNDREPFDEKFYRMWEYYLLSCAGGFRARDVQLYQVVLSKGLKEGYVRP